MHVKRIEMWIALNLLKYAIIVINDKELTFSIRFTFGQGSNLGAFQQ